MDCIERRDIEAFIADQLERWKPATAADRFRGLQRFFGWLVDEGDTGVNPMAKKRSQGSGASARGPDRRPTQGVARGMRSRCPIRSQAGRRADPRNGRHRLAACRACRAAVFVHRLGGIRLRRGRSPNRRHGQGTSATAAAAGTRTTKATFRYLSERSRHPCTDLQWLWIGRTGRLTDSGITQVLRRRSRQAGLPHDVRPHQHADRTTDWHADSG